MSKGYILCALVALLPEPPIDSETRWCSVCAEPVWISPAGLATEMTPICLFCAPGVPDLGDHTAVPARIREELRKEGVSDEEIDRVVRVSEALLMAERRERGLA